MSFGEVVAVGEAVVPLAGKTAEVVSKVHALWATFFPAAAGKNRDNAEFEIWTNRLSLLQQANEKSRLLGSEFVSHVVPLSFAKPFVDAASLQDEPSLQDKWANLLVNSANASSAVQPRVAFVTVLNELNDFDAMILDKLYAVMTHDRDARYGAVTTELPEKATAWHNHAGPDHPPSEVAVSLSNLARLGLILVDKDGGRELLASVGPTKFGRAFVAAVNAPERTVDLGSNSSS
ncbi:Abi-alpha family protein [Rhodoferax sp. WC2427]|uniref:Abi-alpha family protein n=1 Tax=Rhodoferax sp. WC2427 TaxID=3234144 RepID=UPI0034656B7E